MQTATAMQLSKLLLLQLPPNVAAVTRSETRRRGPK
jgi:hypothetical protein